MRICSVPDCHSIYLAKGFCRKHYKRVEVYGTTDLPKRKSTEELFWMRVEKNGPAVSEKLGPCWIWKGGKNGGKSGGYGYLKAKQINYKPTVQTSAHRFAYEFLIGRIPK